MSLVQHVCKEAPGLESLFLISKSNCAFANYRDEAICVEAQQKLHDSKFFSVRLVSRLRKSTVEGAGGTTAPTGPSSTAAASSTFPASNEDPPDVAPSEEGSGSPNPVTVASSEPSTQSSRSTPGATDPAQKDRFFILKSLTVEDLELSVGTGIWATQSHNEETLNNAFKVRVLSPPTPWTQKVCSHPH